MSLKSLIRNSGLKLLALFIALLLWFHAATERVYLVEATFPVSYENLPDSLYLLNDLPMEFRVKIRGQGKELLLLSFFTPTIRVDLRDQSPGRKTIEVLPLFRELPLNRELEIEAIVPNKLELM